MIKGQNQRGIRILGLEDPGDLDIRAGIADGIEVFYPQTKVKDDAPNLLAENKVREDTYYQEILPVIEQLEASADTLYEIALTDPRRLMEAYDGVDGCMEILGPEVTIWLARAVDQRNQSDISRS